MKSFGHSRWSEEMASLMNRVGSKKLQQSKWTAIEPRDKEKHFLVTEVRCDVDGNPQTCILEAVHSHREIELDWRELKDAGRWLMGWS
jgi:tryptophan-rich hypothetical protein